MADAAAKREARRRRILENADNRLKKITNLNSSACKLADGDVGIRKPPEKSTPPPTSRNPHNEPDCVEFEEPEVLFIAKSTATYNSIDPPDTPLEARGDNADQNHPLLPAQQENTDVTRKETSATNYRAVILMLLGLSVRYANLIFDNCAELVGVDLSFLHIEMIFVPLVCYELTELLFFRPPPEENLTFNLLLSLNHVDPKKFKGVLKGMNFVLGALRDMSIYFFAFIFIDLIFSVAGV